MPHSWEMRKIEKLTKDALIKDIGKIKGEERFALYLTARKYLVENILDEIKAIQPEKTDHGKKHIVDVLDNAEELLGGSIKKLNGVELYCLIFSILFHDVGNIIDRGEHQKQIASIYDLARPVPSGAQAAEERRIILKVCEAHSGNGLDGSKNTLESVPGPLNLERKIVRTQLLAAILRFADELAEGEHRTSLYMINAHNYPEESMIFHQYASATHINIDRIHNRISLTYYIKLRPSNTGSSGKEKENMRAIPISKIEEFLFFIYRRIEKLHQERQYSKYYCEFLSPFLRTTVTFNFSYKNIDICTDLQQVELSDLIIPGDEQRKFEDYSVSYKLSNIIGKLEEEIKKINDKAI